MKTALLLTGNPRFSIDFDSQIQNLQNSDIEIFIAFWRRPEGVDPKLSPNWCNLKDGIDVYKRLSPQLPSNYRITVCEVLNDTDIEPIRNEYQPYNSTPINVWQQYKLLQYAHQSVKQLGYFDLVVRSRTDLGLSEPIDLRLAHECLCRQPNTIYIPNNQRYGYEPNFNDQFAIGLPHIMDVYCNGVDRFDELYNRGIKYNPEYLLQTHLMDYGITWPPTSWEIVRDPEHYVPIKHGKWDKI